MYIQMPTNTQMHAHGDMVAATDWAGCDETSSCFFTLICLPGWAPFVFLLYKTKIADRWQPGWFRRRRRSPQLSAS